MQFSRVLLTAAVLALSASVTPLRAQDAKIAVRETKPGLLKRAKVGSEAAFATAQEKAPEGKLVSALIEEDHGRLEYEFVFKTAGKDGTDEVEINAMTGKVLKVVHDAEADEGKEKPVEAQKPPKPL